MKNSFSLSRFWLYAKAECMSSRRIIMLLFASVIGLFTVIYYFNHLIVYNPDFPKNMDLSGAQVFVMLFVYLICIVNASFSFKNFFHKGYSASTMMLPVSQSEKFTYKLVLNNLLIPAVLIGFSFLNNFIWSVAYGIENDVRMVDIVVNEVRVNPLLPIIAMALFPISQYFFGAIFFRRYHFLFTYIATQVIGTLFVFSIFCLDKFGGDFEVMAEWLKQHVTEDPQRGIAILINAWSVLALIFTTLLWFFSWRRFRKLQITK